MIQTASERRTGEEVEGGGHTFNITLTPEEARALSVAAARRGLPRKHLAQNILRAFLNETAVLHGMASVEQEEFQKAWDAITDH